MVHQDRAVARVPVQGDKPVLADRLAGGELREVLMDAHTTGGRSLVVFRWNTVLGEPAEDVPHPTLACLVAPQPVHDSAVDHAAHAGHLVQFGSVHDVAGGGSHDGNELSRFHGPGCGSGDVGVHVAHRDGDALGQPGPGSGLGREVSGGVSQPADRVLQLASHEILELRVQGGEELLGRVSSVLVDALVTGSAGVPDVVSAELPDDPVRSFDPVVHRRVRFRILLEQLESLGELPFGGDQPAVPRQPGFAPFTGQYVDAVRLRLRSMVPPQFHVGVGPVREFLQLVQRGAVSLGRHHRAGREVGGDPDDGGRVDPCLRDRCGHRVPEHVPVVVGHLECPFAGKPGRAVARQIGRQGAGHDGVRVVKNGAAEFLAVADAHHHGPARKGAVVHPDNKIFCAVCCDVHESPPIACRLLSGLR